MKRVEIVYDGHPYTSTENVNELKARILAAIDVGHAFWLTVNEGEGTVKPVDLLITAHTRISLASIDAD